MTLERHLCYHSRAKEGHEFKGQSSLRWADCEIPNSFLHLILTRVKYCLLVSKNLL